MKITTVFTKTLTKALKVAERIHCRVNEESGDIYVCNGFFAAKLNRIEYDAFVRPVTQRDPGNYVLFKGEINPNMEPLDMETILADAVKDATHSMEPAPITFQVPVAGGRKTASLVGYYSESGDFVAGFNNAYSGIVSGNLEFKGTNSVSPMVAFYSGEPVAMILPVRINDKPNITNAVRAWFGAGIGDMVSREDHEETVSGLSASLEKAQENAEEYRNKWDDTACILNRAEREIKHLKADIAAKDEQIALLKAELESKAIEAPETVTEPEEVQDATNELEAATDASTAEIEAVKERMESGTSSIRFFYNGIKVNGGKLIRCHYSLDGRHDGKECVTIYSRGHRGDLPRDMFKVVNNSDSYQDYFEDDHTDVFQDHPLYRFVRAAAVSAGIRDMKRFLPNDLEKIGTAADMSGYYTDEAARKQERLAKLEAEAANLPKIPKQQPTSSDVEAVHALNIAAETALLAEEHERELMEREKVLNEQNDGRRYIESVAAEYPIIDGDPVVTIQWSECPAFYSWEDGELRLSVAAAEIVLKHYDEERAKINNEEGHGGYFKTSFRIDYTEADGEASTYEGRYDLGDNDGGMIAHIRKFGEFLRTRGSFGKNPSEDDKRQGDEIISLAGLLEAHTAAASVVSVQVAPWLEEAIQKRKEAEKQAVQDTFDMICMLTDEQLSAAVLSSPKDKPDVARFFLQELAKRDEKKALSTFRAWQNGEGLEALYGI